MPRASNASLNPHDLRRVAVSAGCDPRTVGAYLAGKTQASTTRAKIEEALRACERADLIRPAVAA